MARVCGQKKAHPPAWAGALRARLPHPDAAEAGYSALPGCGCALTLAQVFARTVCARMGPRVIMHVGAARE